MLDLSDALTRKIFFEVYDHLPRGGPGDTGSTRRALEMAKALPADPQVLDIGCGPGMQTLDLAQALPRARIWAVDNHEPFIRQLQLKTRKYQGRMVAQTGDMFNLKFPEKTFDLLWSEGAIYNIGFENGLRSWKPLLKSGGYAAVTEAVWLVNNPSEECRRFWQEEYPAMTTLPNCLEMIQTSGYEIAGHFGLPETAWWDHFYTPLLLKVETLKQRYRADKDALYVLEEMEKETEVVKNNWGTFNYVFFVIKNT